MKITSPGQMFLDYFPLDKDRSRQIAERHNILFRCLCARSVTVRHPMFEYMTEMGCGLLDKVFNHETLPLDSHNLIFSFPERYMTPLHQRQFVPALVSHPQIIDASMTVIDIVTTSPMIIGNFIKEEVMILYDAEAEAAFNAMAKKYHRPAERLVSTSMHPK